MPGGHESPSGAFKPQTGLRSKCRVFSAARSQRFRRAGSDGLRPPTSASCLGRHSHPAGRCPNSSSLYPPLAAVVAVANKGLLALDNPKAEVETKKCQPLRSTHFFFSLLRFAGPSVAARQLPTGRDTHAVAISNSVTPAQTTRHILWRLHLPLQNPPPHGNRSPVRRGSSWPGPSAHRPVPAARRRHAR